MKKFLAILLTLSLIVSSLFVFTSCKKDSEDKKDENLTVEAVQKDVFATLTDSYEKTSLAFYGSKDDALETIGKALANGSASLTLQSDSFMGPFKKINGVLYRDKDKNALDLNLNYNGKDIGSTLFIDKSALVLQDKNLFNFPNSLSLTYDTFLKNFDTSVFKNIFQFDEMTSNQLKDAINQLKTGFEASSDVQIENDNLEEIKALFKFDVSAETVEINGEEVATIKLSINLTEQFILDFVKAAVKNANMPEADRNALIVNIENELKNYKLSASIQTYINIKTKLFAKSDANIVLTDASGDKLLTVEAKSEFTDNLISAKTSLNFGHTTFNISFDATKTIEEDVTSIDSSLVLENETGKLALKLSKQTSDKLIKSEFSMDFTDKVDDPTTVKNMLKANCDFNKENGDFTIALELNSESKGTNPSDPDLVVNNQVKLALNGNLTHKDGKLTFAINSLTMGDVTVAFKVIAEFNTTANIPTRPESTKEITELTDVEIAEIMQNLQTSPFFEIMEMIGNSNNPEPKPDVALPKSPIQ